MDVGHIGRTSTAPSLVGFKLSTGGRPGLVTIRVLGLLTTVYMGHMYFDLDLKCIIYRLPPNRRLLRGPTL